MQLITAIYCLTLFHSLLDQPLAAELSLNVKCDHNLCCSHSATLGLKYMCYFELFEHACGHFNVSVNAILFQMLISQWSNFQQL